MDTLKKLFPLSFKVKEVKDLVISIIIYAVIDVVCGIVISLLAKLPIIGILFSLVGALIGIYATAGIVLAILVFVKVLK